MYKKILVPLDGSRLAEAVLPHAQALAHTEGAELILLRVAAHLAPGISSGAAATVETIAAELEADSVRYMAELQAQLQAKNFKVSTQIRKGTAAETILKTAERSRVDLIAMSSHGLDAATRWEHGSVTDRVVQDSPIPVLLIHTNKLELQ